MGWGQNNVNLAVESEDGEHAAAGFIGDGEKPAKKWGFGKPKTAEKMKEKENDKEKEKEEKEEEAHGTKLDAPPVGLFETVSICTLEYSRECEDRVMNIHRTKVENDFIL
jgi:hypothetical protein